jgi:hypothetical protein
MAMAGGFALCSRRKVLFTLMLRGPGDAESKSDNSETAGANCG